MSEQRLNVIGLVSGGKDSFFSLLHCIQHGHRVVALANLFPAHGPESLPQVIDPLTPPPPPQDAPESDLNSFMYQTVGHEVIPLYAAATGLPLYRQPIGGGTLCHERDYDFTAAKDGAEGFPQDETESMLPLLKTVMAHHPEANAVCAGAILSTYQRTRVESVALRLGLVPLAYLWKYPILPPPQSMPADGAQLLLDMHEAGLEARIIKVASAGLDERHLWERVSCPDGANRVKASLRRYGTVGAAALGEGGEFETLVINGPSSLFQRKITVPEHGRKTMDEGGGCFWLSLQGARVEDKTAIDGEGIPAIRVPDMLEARFQGVLTKLQSGAMSQDTARQSHLRSRAWASHATLSKGSSHCDELLHWSVTAGTTTGTTTLSIQAETLVVVDKIRHLLLSSSSAPSDITNTVVILRRMDDFPVINDEYAKLFPQANPPSRVTISCGSLLPQGCNILVHVTVPVSSARTCRNGLHVQSRSYWAPANIGPYSQAISVPITSGHNPIGIMSTTVAGQIPLIPATMSLPSSSEEMPHQMQVVLSLQHLWRIGQEMQIQMWSSAVAYFARPTDASAMRYNSLQAGHAWRLAHGHPEGDEDEGDAVDPWDLKYNSQYASMGESDDESTIRLPDWDLFPLSKQNEPDSCIPPMFAVEVEELPRQSSVEWHAHLGLSRLDAASTEVVYQADLGQGTWAAWHLVCQTSRSVFVHTVLTLRDEQHAQDLATAYCKSLERLNLKLGVGRQTTPYLAYADAGRVDLPLPAGVAVIPCHSVWSSEGDQLAAIALFSTTFDKDNIGLRLLPKHFTLQSAP